MSSTTGKTPNAASSNRLKDQQASFPEERAPSDVHDDLAQPRQGFIEETARLNKKDQRFLVQIDQDGLISALQKLDVQLRAAKMTSIISKKIPTDWTGRKVMPGQLGLINHGGLPKILTRAGRYPVMPLRNWWAREWCGTAGLSDTVIEFQGLTVVQVSQNQAAVISDPQNQVFVIRNSGFVALAIGGTYDVLSIVDQAHLDHVVVEERTKVVLGWTHEVKRKSKVGAQGQREYVVATFLNIPANNCAIIQRGEDLELLSAGKHCITNPNVTLRGFCTLGENELEIPMKDIFTRDQISVSLTVYLKWQLQEPLKLANHGYNTPFDALRDKCQVILAQIVAHLDYSDMTKNRLISSEMDGTNTSSAFLDPLKTLAMNDLHLAALKYGIILKDLAFVHRQTKGHVVVSTDIHQNTAVHESPQAIKVDWEELSIAKQTDGVSSIARIEAQPQKVQAGSESYGLLANDKVQIHQERNHGEIPAPHRQFITSAEKVAVGRSRSRPSSPDSYRPRPRQDRPRHRQSRSPRDDLDQRHRSRGKHSLRNHSRPDTHRNGSRYEGQWGGRGRRQTQKSTLESDSKAPAGGHQSTRVRNLEGRGLGRSMAPTPATVNSNYKADMPARVHTTTQIPPGRRHLHYHSRSTSVSSRSGSLSSVSPPPGPPTSDGPRYSTERPTDTQCRRATFFSRVEPDQAGFGREFSFDTREILPAETQKDRFRLQEEQEERLRALEKELTRLKRELETDRTSRVQDQRIDSVEGRPEELMKGCQNDRRLSSIYDMIRNMFEDREAERIRFEEERTATEAKPGIESILQELERKDAEQRELLNRITEDLRADNMKFRDETIYAIRENAHEQIPFNVHGYLDEFVKSLASEVRILLAELGKFREEKRNLQYELASLMEMKSKHGPGGEFDPEWEPAGEPYPVWDSGDYPYDDQAASEPPPPPEPVRPAWRIVQQRSSRKSKKAEPIPVTTWASWQTDNRFVPDLPTSGSIESMRVNSWATWQPNDRFVPTPPSVGPTQPASSRSPGLFGPRSPRDSLHELAPSPPPVNPAQVLPLGGGPPSQDLLGL